MNTVSVIIPVRNEEKFLANCIRSIRADGHVSVVEIIVVDNASTDASVSIAKSLDVKVIEQSGGTIATQRNRGAAIAIGQILAFVDADCTVEPGWAAAALKHFSDEQIVAVGASPGLPPHDTTWLQRTWSFLQAKAIHGPTFVGWIASCNLWIRKSSFVHVNGFDETFETCEDADLGFRIQDLGAIVSDPAIAVQHHREPRTVRDFYRKEVWHGKNSFDGIARGRISIDELPSIIAPLVFVGGAILTLIGLGLCLCLTNVSLTLLWTGIFFLFLVPSLYALRAIVRKGNRLRFPIFWFVYLVYFAARGESMLRWLIQIAVGKRLPGRR